MLEAVEPGQSGAGQSRGLGSRVWGPGKIPCKMSILWSGVWGPGKIPCKMSILGSRVWGPGKIPCKMSTSEICAGEK